MAQRTPSIRNVAVIAGIVLLGAFAAMQGHAATDQSTAGSRVAGPPPTPTAVASTKLAAMAAAPNPALKKQVLARLTPPPAAAASPAPKNPSFQALTCLAAQTPMHAGQIRTPADGDGIPIPGPANRYAISTLWANSAGLTETMIEAGALQANPAQGVLLVHQTNTCTGTARGGLFLTATKVGSLTLTGVSGNTVSLSYAGGSATFDLSALKFSGV